LAIHQLAPARAQGRPQRAIRGQSIEGGLDRAAQCRVPRHAAAEGAPGLVEGEKVGPLIMQYPSV
jgi:hypothetical protein